MEIGVLGPLEVTGPGGPTGLDAAKQRRLLAALVSGAGEPRSTDVLIEALWGESPPRSAPKLLQIYVSRLRKALPSPEKIQTLAAGYRLELDGVTLDSARFESYLEEGRAVHQHGNAALAASLLARGLELWRGPAYADFTYEDFARTEAERLEELRLVAIEEHIEARLALGRHDNVVGEALALSNAHPLRERFQGHAMLALYRCGRQSEALDLYTSVRARLHEELGLEPGPELRVLQRRILQQDRLLLAPERHVGSRMNLPSPPNPLLGRERELADLATLLGRDDVRLLVLTGAGGSGKTRLAIEAARRCAPSFANGATFISLGPLQDPRHVVGEIARVLGVRERPGEDMLGALAAELEWHELLLLIDNAEHLRTAAPIFVDLIRRTARVTVLVTSRAVLHLSGEHVYPVNPLDGAAAYALFLARAREATAYVAFSPENDDVVRQICARLDGLPLAIELAASHVRALSLSELLSRLDARLPLLTGGPRDLPARQTTLRATLDWTFDLLDDRERSDLICLGVFAGSWTLEAAEAVVGTTIDRISSLIDHNLLRRFETVAGSRYAMLETVREYVLERLDGTEGAEGARRMHAEYYLQLVEGAMDDRVASRAAWLVAIEVELDNLRVAFRWTRDCAPELALRLAASVSGFWIGRDLLLEGRGVLEDVVGEAHPPSRELAIVNADLGRILFTLGELETAAEPVESALELAETLQLPSLLADVLNLRGILLDHSRCYEEARALLERALSIARAHDLAQAQLSPLYNLASMMDEQDDHLQAQAFALEGLELSRKTGGRTQRFLGDLIWCNAMLGEWDAALALSDELDAGAALQGRLGEAVGPAWIWVQRGQTTAARDAFERLWDRNQVEDVWSRLCYALAEAVVLRSEERPGEALEIVTPVCRASLSPRHDIWKMAFVEAVEASFAVDDLDRVREYLDEWSGLSPRDQSPFMKAQNARLAARLSIRLGQIAGVESALVEATGTFRELSIPFYVGVALLEHAEWLAVQNRGDDGAPQLAEAAEIFHRLRATPWLERTSRSRVSNDRSDDRRAV